MSHVREYLVHDMAFAWRRHAHINGITDPSVKVLTRSAVPGRPRAGVRPAFFVPASREIVVIVTAEPHRTHEEAIEWMRWMLIQLHNNGNISLFREEEAPACA